MTLNHMNFIKIHRSIDPESLFLISILNDFLYCQYIVFNMVLISNSFIKYIVSQDSFDNIHCNIGVFLCTVILYLTILYNII